MRVVKVKSRMVVVKFELKLLGGKGVIESGERI